MRTVPSVAPEQPDGEYSEGGESSYGSGDDPGSDLESSAPSAPTKKGKRLLPGPTEPKSRPP